MKLDELTGDLLAKAARIYLRIAYPRTAKRQEAKYITWPPDIHNGEVLKVLYAEAPRNGFTRKRYTLRLGNERYPFMKLGLEEWVEPGEFFFFVDTHDELEVAPGDPDFETWTALRNHNLKLKQSIETAWSRARIPTLRQARKLVFPKPGDKTAVVGENARYEGELIRACLEEEGFRTSLTSNPEHLVNLVKRKQPDLVVINSFVGEVPGHTLAQQLSGDPSIKTRVVTLTSPMDEMPHHEAHAILRKPVTREQIKSVLQQLFPTG